MSAQIGPVLVARFAEEICREVFSFATKAEAVAYCRGFLSGAGCYGAGDVWAVHNDGDDETLDELKDFTPSAYAEAMAAFADVSRHRPMR